MHYFTLTGLFGEGNWSIGQIFDHSEPMEHLQGPACSAQPPCEQQAAVLLFSFSKVWFPKWVFTQRNEIHICLNINISQQRASVDVGGEGIDPGSGKSASRCLWEMSIICHWNLIKQDGEMGKCLKPSGIMGLNYDNSPQGRWEIIYDCLSMAKKMFAPSTESMIWFSLWEMSPVLWTELLWSKITRLERLKYFWA